MPITVLRAAIIIGSGSASYEIIKNLVKKLPIFFSPTWARTKCQPISIRDVIKYLVGVLETEETTGKSYDIGGSEVLSYQQMMKTLAQILKKALYPPPLLFYKIILLYPQSFHAGACQDNHVFDGRV